MYYPSPIGVLEINSHKGAICEILFKEKNGTPGGSPQKEGLSGKDLSALKKCTLQLDEYFEGKRKDFDFPMYQGGTDFQHAVWNELMNIPYGRTISYRQLSVRIGNEKAIRAVGTANGRNQLPLVVPCHRVIGSNGSLTGYGGGLWRKQWLLEHENKFANGVSLLF